MSRIVLVSCVGAKRPAPSRARDLYTSVWFRKARICAESLGSRWFILSAEYGLIAPEAVLEPYERTLNRMLRAERVRWADGVLHSLLPLLGLGDEVMFLAGARYREFLVPALQQQGIPVSVPMQGLGIGRQLAYLMQFAARRS